MQSSVAVEAPQHDARFWAIETHVLDDGSVQEFRYLADPGTDVNAVMIERAAAITAQIAAEAAAVPASVTSIQARRAITAAGLRGAVEAAVAAASADVQTLWYTAETVERDNPLLLELAATLGLSSGQLDGLFRQAVRL